MGKVAYSGPLYGAKSNLLTLSYAAGAISSNASTSLCPGATVAVPVYEAWVLTGLYANVSTCSSNAASFKVKVECPSFQGNSSFSTVAFSMNSGTSTSIAAQSTPVTPTPGEYEGLFVPPNSTIRVVSSANSAMGVTNLNMHGFIRFVSSTRPE